MTLWCQKLIDAIARSGQGVYIADFPTYRPDLVEAIAVELGCTHVDFRRERLAPLRFEAHKLPLSAIEDCIREDANETGIVVKNGEALLAAKPAEDRARWFADFLERPRTRIIVLPLALFGRDIANHPLLVRFLPHELPPETLLGQLASMHFS